MHLEYIIDFLKLTDELETAKTLLNTFSKYSKTLEQYSELGMLYERIKAYNESLDMLNTCLVLAKSPDQMFSIRANLAKVYNHLNEPLKSIKNSQLNLQVDPECYESLMEQSFSYYLYGDIKKSYIIQKQLLDNPKVPENVKKRIFFNMGTFDISSGNFKLGLRKMILGGKEIGIWKNIELPVPKWKGESTDKTVLVLAEAGIGDEIINIRFMNEFKSRGIKALWVGNKESTTNLFRDNGFDVVDQKDIKSLDDCVYCESMSLPILLDMNKEDMWKGEYLKAKEEYIEKWKSILPEKFVTIKWSGNPYYDHDLHRTLPLDKLIETVKLYNLPIVSLQIGEEPPEGILKVDIESWDDTLAIQYLAEMNITSCTSTAHSASAIGAKCIVLPPICTYYPWLDLKDNNTSHWYGENTRVFPQVEWRSWDIPLNKLRETIL